MSAKPSAVPSWATDANYTSGPETGNPTKVALSLGAKAQGWRPGDPLAAQNLNDWMNDVGEWLQYLSDGDFEDDVSVEGSFTAGAPSNASGTASATIGGEQLALGQVFTFTSFTFTADAGTNLLTKVAHGLNTGDGPIRVSNSGGALPGGLAALTDYWVVRVSDDTLSLATSLANALRSTATIIDITTNGTGTQTLSVGVACTRATLLRANGNAVVLGVTTTTELEVTTSTYSLPETRSYNIGLAVPGSGVTLSNGSGSTPPTLAMGTSTNDSVLPLTVREGSRITAWSVDVRKTSASGQIEARLVRVNSNTSATVIGPPASNNANNPGEIPLGVDVGTGGGAFPHPVVAGDSYFIRLAGGGVTGDTANEYRLTTA